MHFSFGAEFKLTGVSVGIFGSKCARHVAANIPFGITI